MEIQDLTNNRERIIKNIQKQISAKEAVKGVMEKMVNWLNREDIKGMKPTMANIDKFSRMVIESWIKNDYRPTISKDDLYEKRQKANLESISW